MKQPLRLLATAVSVIAAPFVSFATEESSSTNTADEVQQLRGRIETVERRMAEAAPIAAPGRPGYSYMNIGFDVLFDAGWASTPDVETIQPGGHDPSQRGFAMPNSEVSLDGAVDPYFKGFANIVLLTAPDDGTEIELEEAYGLSTSLPGGTQIKAGRFFVEFGRQNSQHPHAWAFVDQPLALNRMFGEDGLRQNGARLSWLAPTEHYTEFMLGVFNGQGGDAFSFRFAGETDADGVDRLYGRATTDRSLDSAGDLLFVPRVASSFDLTDSQTFVLGASAALGPNDTGEDTRTLIYGVDAFWKWKAANAEGGWPFVTWQTEAIGRDYEAGADIAAGLPAETLHDWGAYSQLMWGFVRRWAAGLRGEYVTGDKSLSEEANAERQTEKRVSPNITWYSTEFSKLRLQYNRHWRENAEDEDAMWFQFEFMLGAHASHKF